MDDVTILIKTFLRDEYLFNCIRSAKEQYPDINLIVADDGHHSDNKHRRLSDLGVSQYIRLPFNSSPITIGRNLMVQAATTPYVVISDDDFTYTPNTRLEDLRTMMDIVDIAGGAIWQDGKIRRYEGVFRPVNPERMGMYTIIGQECSVHNGVQYVPAEYVFNFFLAKTGLLRNVKWDERMRASYEHEDFFLSAKNYGAKCAYCPNSVVTHRGGPADSEEYCKYRFNSKPADRAIFESKWGFVLG